MSVVTFKVFAITTLLSLQGFGCGVDFKVPKDHFDGVNEYGYVSYWDTIGDLDLGEGLIIPLVIGFESNREWSSPYLGYGWILPLFDSNLVQTGENSFQMIAPDGYTVPLGRDRNKPTLLSGPKGWKGEISDTITLWATCGWKLVYTKGKITSIGTPKGKTLLINRDATGVAKEATYDGKVVIRVERDFKGMVTGLVLRDKRIGLEQTEKPRIQSVLGRNLVVAKDLSLGKVIGEPDSTKTFEHKVTNDLQPSLAITTNGEYPRAITWDALTKLILTDQDWKYKVELPETNLSNAKVTRTKGNEMEFWNYDPSSGVDESLGSNGLFQHTSWFTSGALSGKIRELKRNGKSGESDTTIKYIYSSDAKLKRILTSHHSIKNNSSLGLYQEIEKAESKTIQDGSIVSRLLIGDNPSKDEFSFLLDSPMKNDIAPVHFNYNNKTKLTSIE